MQESTTTPGTDPVRHEITITTVRLPAGNPRRADCVCGWQSGIAPSHPRAAALGEAHLCEVARLHAVAVRERIENARGLDDARSAVPCPWWCNRTDATHAEGSYDSSDWNDDHALFRIHAANFGEVALAIVQDEISTHGALSYGEAKLSIYETPETPEEARRFARQLTAAAGLLDRIRAGHDPQAPHAPWCIAIVDIDSAFCGHGTDCYWDSTRALGAVTGIVEHRHQTAKNRRYGHAASRSWVSMSRNHAREHQELEDGTDDYLVTLVQDRDDESVEVDLTVPEARKLCRILTAACDTAYADRLATR